jgi:hypothetical protein
MTYTVYQNSFELIFRTLSQIFTYMSMFSFSGQKDRIYLHSNCRVLLKIKLSIWGNQPDP